jgi:hypothetical protein
LLPPSRRDPVYAQSCGSLLVQIVISGGAVPAAQVTLSKKEATAISAIHGLHGASFAALFLPFILSKPPLPAPQHNRESPLNQLASRGPLRAGSRIAA